MLKRLRWILEFSTVYLLYSSVRLMPWSLMRATAWLMGWLMSLLPAAQKLVRANIHAAMPELPESEVARIARSSFDHLMWNLLEYVWCVRNAKRIRRCCCVEENTRQIFQTAARKKEQVIFVNPHLGSWEISGLMTPFYTGLQLAAIAKPMKNPYLNVLLNSGSRESVPGIKVIFSKGAMRASLKALREGWSIGTLIDQNTRVRDGGVFVNFFGLPVPSSTAPATLKSFCDQKGIPCQIYLACTLRNSDGKLVGEAWALEKSFDRYASHTEILQELMARSEKLIRENPEQYLWMYRRFQYISDKATPEQLKRYPWYATRPGGNFFRKTFRKKTDTGNNGKTGAQNHPSR